MVTVAPGSPYRSTPALVLDRAGRPLIAYQNQDGTRLMLATCIGHRCASTAVARMRGAGEGLAMTISCSPPGQEPNSAPPTSGERCGA